MRSEKQLQDYSKKKARLNDIGFYKLECVGQTGFPDVMLTKNGHAVFVEFKTPTGKGRVSARQALMMAGLQLRGMEVYVVDQPEQVDLIITGLNDRKPNVVRHSLI